jgi:Chromo (CHRromatin Organisation MOdifier) domain
LIGPKEGLRLVPEEIVARKITKRGNVSLVQILVKWANTTKEECAWEVYVQNKKIYPELILRDKELLKGGGNAS